MTIAASDINGYPELRRVTIASSGDEFEGLVSKGIELVYNLRGDKPLNRTHVDCIVMSASRVIKNSVSTGAIHHTVHDYTLTL